MPRSKALGFQTTLGAMPHARTHGTYFSIAHGVLLFILLFLANMVLPIVMPHSTSTSSCWNSAAARPIAQTRACKQNATRTELSKLQLQAHAYMPLGWHWREIWRVSELDDGEGRLLAECHRKCGGSMMGCVQPVVLLRGGGWVKAHNFPFG